MPDADRDVRRAHSLCGRDLSFAAVAEALEAVDAGQRIVEISDRQPYGLAAPKRARLRALEQQDVETGRQPFQELKERPHDGIAEPDRLEKLEAPVRVEPNPRRE